MMNRPCRGALAALVTVLTASPSLAQAPTRGVGVYPGDPAESFAPDLVPDAGAYRNLALRRAAYHSSSRDYNLTAQLVTDGIPASGPPRWLSTSTSQRGTASPAEREFLVDHSSTSAVDMDRFGAWAQLELGGGPSAPRVDRIRLEVRPRREPFASRSPFAFPGDAAPGEWAFEVAVSDDGRAWTEVGLVSGHLDPPPPLPQLGDWAGFQKWFRAANPRLTPEIALAPPRQARLYRVTLRSAGGERWSLAEVSFFDGARPVEVGGPYHFTSAWMSAGSADEWVSVDLGARCTFDRVALHWVSRPAEGRLQVSDDGAAWRDVLSLPLSAAADDDLRLPTPQEARWVRVFMSRPTSPEGYALGELEVFGRGGLVARPKPGPGRRPDRRLDLAAGSWRVQRDSLVKADGRGLSQPGFAVADWVVATVPGTVLSSYENVGAIPDPNFGDNQLMVSDSFFYADFWYRTEFEMAPHARGRHVFLNFDGVNWKAEAYLNGERLGRVEGAFTRGRFDVTRRLRAGRNALAVRVEKNRTPGSAKQKTLETPGQNGGALGADNPTYHASIGWDWIPTVRGRNVGLWNDVYLTTSGPVTIEDPFVRTTLPLPTTSSADVRVEVALVNHDAAAVPGTLRGRFGEAAFEQKVTVRPNATRTVVFDPTTHGALRLTNPRLWWPNGYGEPNLYDVSLEFTAAGAVSDGKAFKVGVRQLSYDEKGGALRIFVNGRRLVARGGNWGFPETNLRYRGREYDAAVGYHRDLNFTMIRNWVGQTGDDEFYEACDRHGIVVWQDFWLANPWDGPDPDDEPLFLANARDTIKRIRNHPSIGLYCGRNEGDPPPGLDQGLRDAIAQLHADVRYISNSAAGLMSGGGPYSARPPRFYFEERATEKLHSELGMPNIVEPESLRQMMPERSLWPPGLEWGLHDFTLGGAQGLATFRRIIDETFGGADDADQWVRLAQLVNYDGYRAMFEAQSRNRMGVLLWMSHPAWPSFVWQTYDYYLDPTAGYFGSRKGAEPLHVQWNPLSDAVEVVNYSGGEQKGLTAHAEILNLDGSRQWEKTASVDSTEDSVQSPFTLEFPAAISDVHFVRLRLARGDETVSENVYWRGKREGHLRGLRTLPTVSLRVRTRVERQGERFVLTTDIANPSSAPALLVRLSPERATSGDRIRPALFSDNDLVLMPGERKTVRTVIEARDARSEEPRIAVSGFNVIPGWSE
jgi:hypothetical protein